MSDGELNILLGELIDHNKRIEQQEFQRMCRISEDFLIELIDEGILESELVSNARYFRAIHIQKVKKANRLSSDLGINIAGIALILELLERIEHLEKR